ncbi:hypothetical protein CK203_025964 [Vitis vinifera]|uniref:Uncharacterized protein n=1 Tax=Vitis vinifera TaxID=29760 RepID=A0A438IKP6_VITVI|nr:hypothetical protein CK203_025964 [Vitis vinifera]
MGIKAALKWQILYGSLARRLFLRACLFASVLAIVPLVQIVREARAVEPFAVNFEDCPLDVSSNPLLFRVDYLRPLSALVFPLFGALPCKGPENSTIRVFRELMEMDLLDNEAKTLCVGVGSGSAISALRELGFSNALGVDRHPFFSLLRKSFIYELDFKENSFDFVFSRALDKVSVPALLMLEIERVLRPGGIGAILVGAHDYNSGSLIRSATPVSSFLKSSNVVHVSGINSFTLVVFEKRFDTVSSFEYFRLPDVCHQSKTTGREYVSSSIENLIKPFYTVNSRTSDIYVIDHDTSALSAYVRKPGITFVYHPGLAGRNAISRPVSDEDLSMPLYAEGFDFVHWFKETVVAGDFVVLMMNAREVELKLLFELFKSGAICLVDEIFLHCSEGVDCNTATCKDCMTLFKGLRNSGVFVHQWWGF